MKDIPFFFAYNIPLQVRKTEDGNISILNYMPRKERVEWVDLHEDESDGMTHEEFLLHAAAHFDNLARQMREAAKSNDPFIYYHDEGIQPYTINGTTYGNKPTE